MSIEKRLVAIIFVFVVFLSILSLQRWAPISTLATTSADKETITRAVSFQSINTTTSEHCVIHIHGLHHSGTGFTRQVVYDSLGAAINASKHTKTGKPEDEGAHIQTIYPRYRQRLRDPSLCGLPGSRVPTVESLHTLYYCPPLVDSIGANISAARHELLSQWAQYWDMTRPYLIQKTPTMDVVLLEELKLLYPTVHVIVMRHPLSWKRLKFYRQVPKYKSLQQDPRYLPLTWWKVWTFVLEQLALKQVESFVVVQYEELVQQQEATSNQLSEYIQSKCNLDHGNLQQSGRRRLHLHPKVRNSSKFLESREAIQEYNSCRANAKCVDFMNQTANVLQDFGYRWNPQDSMQPPDSSGDDSLLLYTSDKPPTMELVERMKELVNFT